MLQRHELVSYCRSKGIALQVCSLVLGMAREAHHACFDCCDAECRGQGWLGACSTMMYWAQSQ